MKHPAKSLAAPLSGIKLVPNKIPTLSAGTYTDPGQTGLQLRVLARRKGLSRSWLLRFKFQGQESRILLGHFPALNLDAARGRAREFRDFAARGIDPRQASPRRRLGKKLPPSAADTAPGGKHSIEHLASMFMTRHVKYVDKKTGKPRRKRPEIVQAILDKDVLPKWKNRDARTVTAQEVITLLNGIVDRGSPVMANRVGAVLAQMFKFGVQQRIVDASPVVLLEAPGGEETSRDRILVEHELKAFFASPGLTKTPKLQTAITLLLLTGQRRGELALARQRDIDLANQVWTIPKEHSKNGLPSAVPLSEWACHEMSALLSLAGNSAYLMPDATGRAPADPKLLTRGLARCRKRFEAAKIAAFTLHDLRRTCRTGLARLKVDADIAERVLNHVPEKLRGTYDIHDYLDEKREALNKWAEYLEGLRP